MREWNKPQQRALLYNWNTREGRTRLRIVNVQQIKSPSHGFWWHRLESMKQAVEEVSCNPHYDMTCFLFFFFFEEEYPEWCNSNSGQILFIIMGPRLVTVLLRLSCDREQSWYWLVGYWDQCCHWSDWSQDCSWAISYPEWYYDQIWIYPL